MKNRTLGYMLGNNGLCLAACAIHVTIFSISSKFKFYIVKHSYSSHLFLHVCVLTAARTQFTGCSKKHLVKSLSSARQTVSACCVITQVPFCPLPQVSLGFHGNQALVASAVFLNNLRLCSWSGLSPPFFDSRLAFRWNFVNLE